MFKIKFFNSRVRFFSGNATMQDLHDEVQTHGQIVGMERVEARVPTKRVFDVRDVIITEDKPFV